MKRVLMLLGTITLLFGGIITAGLGFIGGKAYFSATDNKQAAIAAVKEISKDWSFEGRYDVVDASLVRVADTPRIVQFVRNIGRLGQLVATRDAQQVHFGMSNTKGTTAIIEFQGEFTNGVGKVIATMRKSDGKMKLFGIKIKDGKLTRAKPQTAV